MTTQLLVVTVISLPGAPAIRISIEQETGSEPATSFYRVTGPYREPVTFATYAAARRTYANIIDAILDPL